MIRHSFIFIYLTRQIFIFIFFPKTKKEFPKPSNPRGERERERREVKGERRGWKETREIPFQPTVSNGGKRWK
jgi:hypothetical protein